jgi:hypothetical protein
VQGYTGSFAEYTAHYLEAAPVNQSTSLKWCSHSFPSYCNVTGAMGIAIGTGKANTAAILAANPDAPAAKACNEYSNNGKNDWFLPSKDELNEMYKARAHFSFPVGTVLWSSSQYSNTGAWNQGMGSGDQSGGGKNSVISARAIRAF